MVNKFAENIKDLLYEFLQEPTREKFSELILNGTGEHNAIDFKKEWIKEQKIAQIILGIANTCSGAIIFGIEEKEDGTSIPIGLSKIVDKSEIHKKISKYLPDNLIFNIFDFDYSGEDYARLKDKKFQVLIINSEEEKLPYVCLKTSDDIKEGCIYTRRGTNTVQANAVEVEHLLSKRIDTMYSTSSQLELEEHLKQLKILYKNIDKQISYTTGNKISDILLNLNLNILGKTVYKENENYPKENFDEFIARMIREKKLKIEKVLDLK